MTKYTTGVIKGKSYKDVVTTPVTNDQLIERHDKLVWYIIRKWAGKPKDYEEHVHDIHNEVFMALFSIPVYGKRRNNPSYINTVIQTTVNRCVKEIKARQVSEAYSLDGWYIDDSTSSASGNDYNQSRLSKNILKSISFVDKDQQAITDKMDIVKKLTNIYENELDLDEKIIISTFLNSKYGITKGKAVNHIARELFMDKKEAQEKFTIVLNKFRNRLLE